MFCVWFIFVFFCFKQKTAYEMRISDWSSDVCSSDLATSPPEVSVVIPVKDRRDLLKRALAALDRQSFRDFEVIVVDDGSTDGADQLAAATTVAGRPVRQLGSAACRESMWKAG